MEKIKKILSFALILCLIMGLAACGAEERPGADAGTTSAGNPTADAADEEGERIEKLYRKFLVGRWNYTEGAYYSKFFWKSMTLRENGTAFFENFFSQDPSFGGDVEGKWTLEANAHGDMYFAAVVPVSEERELVLSYRVDKAESGQLRIYAENDPGTDINFYRAPSGDSAVSLGGDAEKTLSLLGNIWYLLGDDSEHFPEAIEFYNEGAPIVCITDKGVSYWGDWRVEGARLFLDSTEGESFIFFVETDGEYLSLQRSYENGSMLSSSACYATEFALAGDEIDFGAPADGDAPDDGPATDSGSDAPAGAVPNPWVREHVAVMGADGRLSLYIYEGQIIVQTPEGTYVSKDSSAKKDDEVMLEYIPDNLDLIFLNEDGTLWTYEPIVGNTGLTNSDIVKMSDSDLAMYPFSVRLAGCWHLRSAPTGGTGEFEYIRIDPDGYVYAVLNGIGYDGMWWIDHASMNGTNMLPLYLSLRPDETTPRNYHIYGFEVHPQSLSLRYIDSSRTPSATAYEYSREALDTERYAAYPGHENLSSRDIEPYIHGIWYCDDPYLDMSKLPYKMVFSPSLEAERIVAFFMVNINDRWTTGYCRGGELYYIDPSTGFDRRAGVEIIDENTIKLSTTYFQGSFDADKLGRAEAVYTRISYYANMSHKYGEYDYW